MRRYGVIAFNLFSAVLSLEGFVNVALKEKCRANAHSRHLTGRAHLALFHGIHDDLLQPGGLLLVSGDPCQPDNVMLCLPKAMGAREKS